MRETLAVSDPLAELAMLPGVPSALARTRAAIDAVLRDRGHRRLSDEQRSSARLAAARANAALTGDPDRWLAGAVRLSTELEPLAALIRVAPAQALARAHVLVGRGVVPDAELGRMAGGPATTGRMTGLSELLTGTTTASALVLGAVVHAELAVLQPLGEASGLVARGAEQLVLISAGLDPAGVVVVPYGHATDPEGYAAGLAGYADGGLAGVTSWILQCCAAVTRGADRLAMISSGRTQ
jgi:hypothetical protein